MALRDILFSVGFEKISPQTFKSLQEQVSKRKLKIPVTFSTVSIQKQLNAHTFKINARLSSGAISGITRQVRQAIPSSMSIGAPGVVASPRRLLKAPKPPIPPKSTKPPENMLAMMGSLAKWAIGWTLLYGIVRSVQAELSKSVTTIIDVNEAMIQLSRTIQTMPGDSMSGILKTLKNDAVDLATKYGESVTDIIGIQQNWALQGKNVVEIQDLTRATILATESAFLSSADAARFLTATIQQFNLHSSRAIEVVDVLDNVSKRYAVTAKDLGEGMSRAGAAAKAAGLDFQELAGLVATVQQATQLGGSTVSTQIRTLLLRFTQPSKRKQLAELTRVGNLPGISTVTKEGELRSPLVVLGEMADRYNKLTGAQQANINIMLAGVRQSAVLLSILNDFPTVLASIGDAYSSAGSAADDTAKRMEALKKQFSLIRAEIERIAVSIGEGGGEGVLSKFAKDTKALVVGLESEKEVILSLLSLIKPLAELFLLIKVGLATWAAQATFLRTGSIIKSLGVLGSKFGYVGAAVGAVTVAWLLMRKEIAKGNEIIKARERVDEFTDSAKKLTDEINNLGGKTKYGQTLIDFLDREMGKQGVGTNAQQERVNKSIETARINLVKFFKLEGVAAGDVLEKAKLQLAIDKKTLETRKELVQTKINEIEALKSAAPATRPISEEEFKNMRDKVKKEMTDLVDSYSRIFSLVDTSGVSVLPFLEPLSNEQIDKEAKRRIIEQRVMDRRETQANYDRALTILREERVSKPPPEEGVPGLDTKESYTVTAIEKYRNDLLALKDIYKITSGIVDEYTANQTLLNAKVSLAKSYVDELVDANVKFNDSSLKGTDILENLTKKYGGLATNQKNLKVATNDLAQATADLNKFKKEQVERDTAISRVGLRGGGVLETLKKQLELAQTTEGKDKILIQLHDEEIRQSQKIKELSQDNVLAQAEALSVNEKQLFALKERIINEKYITDEYRRQVELISLANDKTNAALARQTELRERILGIGVSTLGELREGKNIGASAKGFLSEIQDKIFSNVSRNIFGDFAQKIAERLDTALQSTDKFVPMQNAIINAHVAGIRRGFVGVYGAGAPGAVSQGVSNASPGSVPGSGPVQINGVPVNATPTLLSRVGRYGAGATPGISNNYVPPPIAGEDGGRPGVDTRATALFPPGSVPGAGPVQINGVPVNATPTLFSRVGGYAGVGAGIGMAGNVMRQGGRPGSFLDIGGSALAGAGTGLGLASIYGATVPVAGAAAGGATGAAAGGATGAAAGGAAVSASSLAWGAGGGAALALAPMLGAKYGRLAGAATGTAGGAMIGTAILPGWGSLIGALAGGAFGSLFGKHESKTEEERTVEKSIRQSLDSKINLTNSTLKLINRNLESLRGAPELYPLPRSFYFRQRAGGGSGVNVQVNIGNEAIDDRFVNVVSKTLNNNIQRGVTAL